MEVCVCMKRCFETRQENKLKIRLNLCEWITPVGFSTMVFVEKTCHMECESSSIEKSVACVRKGNYISHVILYYR